MEQRVAAGGLTVQSEVNFLFALGKAYEDRGDFERGLAVLPRRATSRQRAEVSYDPVQTEAMNDRLVAGVFARSSSQSRARRGRPGSGADLHPRACRARARRCSSRSSRATARSRARASCPTSAASRPGSTATAPTASTIPKRCASCAPQNFARARRGLPRATRACTGARARRASSTRCRTTSRTSGCSR